MKQKFINAYESSGLNPFEAACLMGASPMRIYSWLRLTDTARNPSKIHLEVFKNRLADPALVARAKVEGAKLRAETNEKARARNWRENKSPFKKRG